MPDIDDNGDINVGALAQRVYGVEKTVEALSSQTTKQIADLRAENTSNISAMFRKIDDVSKKIDDQQSNAFKAVQASQPNWGFIIGGVISACVGVSGLLLSFVTVVGSLALSPVQNELIRVNTDVKELRSTTVPKDDIMERRKATNESFKRIDESVKDLDTITVKKGAFVEMEKRIDERHADSVLDMRRAVDRLQSDIRGFNDKLVSRDENKAHWDEISERMIGMTNRINDIQKEAGSTFSVGDQLKNLQNQLDQVRTLLANALAAIASQKDTSAAIAKGPQP